MKDLNMSKTKALKEILRIIQWNGGIHQGQEIKIDHNCGLWRIEKLAEDALTEKENAS
jgi:hypothetical protein